MQKEYCEQCRLPLQEWEWCGRGFCEMCEDKMSDRKPEQTTDNVDAKNRCCMCNEAIKKSSDAFCEGCKSETRWSA